MIKKKHSFTLVELLIVILIIGVLAAVIVPKLAVIDKRAKERATLVNLKAIRKALELYRFDYPYDMPTSLAVLAPQYIQKIPPNMLNPDVSKRTTYFNIFTVAQTTAFCDVNWNWHPPASTYGWMYFYCNWEHYHSAGPIPGNCQRGNKLVTLGYPGDPSEVDSDGTPYYQW